MYIRYLNFLPFIYEFENEINKSFCNGRIWLEVCIRQEPFSNLKWERKGSYRYGVLRIQKREKETLRWFFFNLLFRQNTSPTFRARWIFSLRRRGKIQAGAGTIDSYPIFLLFQMVECTFEKTLQYPCTGMKQTLKESIFCMIVSNLRKHGTCL